MDSQLEVRAAIDRIDQATEHMLGGDCGPWLRLMFHRDDVTALGAYGGYATGWDAVSARLVRTAAGYGEGGAGGTTSRENIATWVGADLACVVDIETHRTALAESAEPVTFRYRATHVLRREPDGWRVVLRHADPLTDFRGPAFAHVEAQAPGAVGDLSAGGRAAGPTAGR
jgi:ketosteroid isomerase-like protein